MSRARLLWLSLVGCGGNGAIVMSDPAPAQTAWADVSLTLVGSQVNDDKRRACLEEAHRAGVRFNPVAQRRGTLVLNDEGNRLQLGNGEQVLGKWTRETLCKVAILRAAGIDQRVLVMQRSEPPGCRYLGPVNAADNGFVAPVGMVSGAYDGALVTAQLTTLRMGGNVLVIDRTTNGMNVNLSGRAFVCLTQQPQYQYQQEQPQQYQYPQQPAPPLQK